MMTLSAPISITTGQRANDSTVVFRGAVTEAEFHTAPIDPPSEVSSLRCPQVVPWGEVGADPAQAQMRVAEGEEVHRMS
jgi:hypothetical protein